MNFRELPISVQNIAAQLLADRMPCATNTSENEPAMALAQNINDAFTKLYNPMKT
ncbi:formyltetrahydrofolate deformylase, partial [Salmonella enterica subsp. enterica serovar Enteritidis]|nr:formyltetrahydrofolate deformylase [Salmonella enterica subsp. enterica serovar Enteritidis]EDQ3752449.1 formyltetrahydrofolate deformylase [Salmonella enterica subsp. enterica]